ncbi:MAG: Maf family protein [Oceanococcus sp.]
MISKDIDPTQLILASSSPYRKMQLESLGLDFLAISPNCDEGLYKDEAAEQATSRLAHDKAHTLLQRHPTACVIGSDQLCCTTHGELVGKPGSIEAAHRQLQQLSGQMVQFVSAVCVLSRNHQQQHISTTQVHFRALTCEEIQRYIALEPDAIYCAGSFMSEALGISLCESIRCDDPSALIGLPLIATARMLRKEGFRLP